MLGLFEATQHGSVETILIANSVNRKLSTFVNFECSERVQLNFAKGKTSRPLIYILASLLDVDNLLVPLSKVAKYCIRKS